MYAKIQETAQWLKERISTQPKTAIILGTGLGRLAEEIKVKSRRSVRYSDIIPASLAPNGTIRSLSRLPVTTNCPTPSFDPLSKFPKFPKAR